MTPPNDAVAVLREAVDLAPSRTTCIEIPASLARAILAHIATLATRLEIDPAAPGYDGIYCRDETIRLLDAKVERLTAERDAAVARADDERAKVVELTRAVKELLQYEGHRVYCGHGNDMQRPCVCGLIKKQELARAITSGAHHDHG